MQYRIAGKQQTLTIGPYPPTGLAEAPRQRDAAREALVRGDDPAAPEKAAARRGMTFTAAANAYWSGRVYCLPLHGAI